MANGLNDKVKTATKWSALSEISVKLVNPITSMLLARLLTPEAFGVVATLTMIISFAEIFTDAGFQKYLIQHEFESDEDREQNTNVAFWSNLIMSILLWVIIGFFSDTLALMVGSPGLGYVITIACISIPLAAFSSIQMALYKRDLDFKTLFKVRIVGTLIPIFVTIPLALYFRNFWALLLGTISKDLMNAILLSYYSNWKPRLYYDFEQLKKMFSFTMWSMFEQISIWLTNYMDIFIVGIALNAYYLGLYRTSTATVGQILHIITASTTPVLFSSLSRLQHNNVEFRKLFFKFQKWVGLIILPLGVGIFCYSDIVVAILLGDQWTEASGFIGLWGITSCLMVVLSHYCSEIYRSKGKPRLSTLAQWLHLIVLLPTVYISVRYGYEVLYIARSLVRFEGIAVNMIIMYFVIKISPIAMIRNIMPELVGCCAILLLRYLIVPLNESIYFELMTIILSILAYFVVITLFPQERKLLIELIKRYKK